MEGTDAWRSALQRSPDGRTTDLLIVHSRDKQQHATAEVLPQADRTLLARRFTGTSRGVRALVRLLARTAPGAVVLSLAPRLWQAVRAEATHLFRGGAIRQPVMWRHRSAIAWQPALGGGGRRNRYVEDEAGEGSHDEEEEDEDEESDEESDEDEEEEEGSDDEPYDAAACQLPHSQFNADMLSNCEQCMCGKNLATKRDVYRWISSRSMDNIKSHMKWRDTVRATFQAEHGRPMTDAEMDAFLKKELQEFSVQLGNIQRCTKQGFLCDPAKLQELRQLQGTLMGRQKLEIHDANAILLDGHLGTRLAEYEGDVSMKAWPWAPEAPPGWGRSSVFATGAAHEKLSDWHARRKQVGAVHEGEAELVEAFLDGVLGGYSQVNETTFLVGQDSRFAPSYLVAGAIAFAEKVMQQVVNEKPIYHFPSLAAYHAEDSDDGGDDDEEDRQMVYQDWRVDEVAEVARDVTDDVADDVRALMTAPAVGQQLEATEAELRAMRDMSARAKAARKLHDAASEARQAAEMEAEVLARRDAVRNPCGAGFKRIAPHGYDMNVSVEFLLDGKATTTERERIIAKGIMQASADMEKMNVPFLVPSRSDDTGLVPVLRVLCRPTPDACILDFPTFAGVLLPLVRHTIELAVGEILKHNPDHSKDIVTAHETVSAAHKRAVEALSTQARMEATERRLQEARTKAARALTEAQVELVAATNVAHKLVLQRQVALRQAAEAKVRKQLQKVRQKIKKIIRDNTKVTAAAKAARRAWKAAQAREEKRLERERKAAAAALSNEEKRMQITVSGKKVSLQKAMRMSEALVERQLEAVALREDTAKYEESLVKGAQDYIQRQRTAKANAKLAGQLTLQLKTKRAKWARLAEVPGREAEVADLRVEIQQLQKRLRKVSKHMATAQQAAAERRRKAERNDDFLVADGARA